MGAIRRNPRSCSGSFRRFLSGESFTHAHGTVESDAFNYAQNASVDPGGQFPGSACNLERSVWRPEQFAAKHEWRVILLAKSVDTQKRSLSSQLSTIIASVNFVSYPSIRRRQKASESVKSRRTCQTIDAASPRDHSVQQRRTCCFPRVYRFEQAC